MIFDRPMWLLTCRNLPKLPDEKLPVSPGSLCGHRHELMIVAETSTCRQMRCYQKYATEILTNTQSVHTVYV